MLSLIQKGIRWFFTVIDNGLYTIVKALYNLIIDLANIKIFSDSAISDFATRVYTLLALFMLFRITFSFITYIIDPNKMLDKTAGAPNIIKNVIITLVLIIVAPRGFDLLYDAQSAILEDNILPQFILGVKQDEVDEGMSGLTVQMYNPKEVGDGKEFDPCGNGGYFNAATTADYISLMVFRNFFKPLNVGDGISEANLQSSLTRTDGHDGKNYCNPTGDPSGNTIGAIANKVTVNSFLSNDNIYNSYKYGDVFAIDYTMFISTAVAVVLCLIFISFAFDIAVRSIKLSFLQLIAPIPIISYIDPKSGKSGMFQKWLTEVGKTWANVFVRLAAVYFSVYVIQQLSGDRLFYTDNYQIRSGTFWIDLFIIFGALMFAKQLPNLIETLIPGLKTKGSFELNPFKKVSNDAMFGKQIVGAGAGALGAGIGLTSFAGYKIADRIKNGAQNKANLAEKRMNVARRAYEKDRTPENSFNAALASIKYKQAKKAADDAKDEKEKKAQEKANKKEERESHGAYRFAKASIRGAVQVKDAMVGAYKGGKDLKLHPIEIGKDSAKKRAYKDEYGLVDRIKDTATDFVGIKNDSGTTSAIKQEIDRLEKQLERINRNIEMANRSFSDMQTKMGAEFTNAVKFNADGTLSINESYSFPVGGINGITKDQLEAQIKLRNDLEKQREDTQKDIKKQQGLRDRKPGSST